MDGWMETHLFSLNSELYLLLMEPVNVIGCSPFTFEKHVTMLVCMFCMKGRWAGYFERLYQADPPAVELDVGCYNPFC